MFAPLALAHLCESWVRAVEAQPTVLPTSLPVQRWEDVVDCQRSGGPPWGRLDAWAVAEAIAQDTDHATLDSQTLVAVYWGTADGRRVTTLEHLGSLTLPAELNEGTLAWLT